MYIGICAEADMYVPAFPQMINFFGVAENEIQQVLSINFLGLCVSGIIAGPLSDSYGRRAVLFWGMLVFFVSSVFCIFCDSFYSLLFWRLVQGIAAAIPMVVGASSLWDKYSPQEAGKLVGIINGFITAFIAGAPIIGAWISEAFDWKANFVTMAVVAGISFLGTALFLEETLDKKQRRAFNLHKIACDYLKIMSDFKFITYSVIACFPFIAIMIYISNLSVIFINHLGMEIGAFGYYQATTMLVFIFSSLFSTKLISAKGVDFTKHLGGLLSILGSSLLFLTALIYPQCPILICASMAVVSFGGGMLAGTFGAKAMEDYIGMTGAAMALMTALRQLSVIIFVSLTEVFFDGTIVPVASIIFLLMALCTIGFFCFGKTK